MQKASVRQRFAQVFMALVPLTPNKRVSVTSLCDHLGINRKTFYHYFDNIDQLMIWIYRNYLATMLDGERFARWEKVCPPPSAFDPYPDLVFYARNIQDGSLCQAAYFKEMAYHWENHREYYSVVFSSTCYIDLFDYIVALFLPPFREDVEFFLEGRNMPAVAIDFLAEYHVMGVFGRLRYHYTQTNKFIMQNEIDPFWNYAHTVMRESVEGYYDTMKGVGVPRLLR